MKIYSRLSRPRQPYECMCIHSGARRKTLHLPRIEIDPVTRTLGPMLGWAFALVAADVAKAESSRQAGGAAVNLAPSRPPVVLTHPRPSIVFTARGFAGLTPEEEESAREVAAANKETRK